MGSQRAELRLTKSGMHFLCSAADLDVKTKLNKADKGQFATWIEA